MKRTQLAHGLDVTSIGLGSAPLGGLFSAVSDADAEATVAKAWSLGVRFFDTAPLYGFGLAEERLGAFLRQQPRESYAISTKVGRLLRTPDSTTVEDDHFKDAPALRPKFDFSYDGVMRSVEESLDRLGLDRVDVLLVHDPDDHYDAAVNGAFRALMRLRDDGTVKAIGSGMNQCEMLTRFAEAVPVDCFLLAGRYTLLDQGALDALFPVCAAKNIGILLGGIYNSGILANPHTGAKFNYEDAGAALVSRAIELDQLCRKHGTELKAAALQFCMAHPAVTVAVMGARNASEVADNIAMSERAVPQAFWQELRAKNLVDARAPLPGGA
ncbi:aldo/keto reductase [Bradyrhizobium sp. WYCCWR 13023]|uniref:Aldo/keto reductase n=1 Tax=Bradyrhizobium zhengyangense TaxID=2911009 RepID=A0A9X1RDN3_9BRAD|nr:MULTISPECIES: aldo/keto reductase [Bradyrhizobium]MCG2629705.1 aldo/keto reductase [Bradyrhizobium zhengyangense]MCG2642303.1 aldo/keto reductase [Bradyrhizobium zhengyangense]MCG2667784.1 aldo/keto reductase [Bradyrhizobium zhengyangense]MDA9519863.1 aldo/keto reductase [Bradyrhizobium sp. CCBAU 11434]